MSNYGITKEGFVLKRMDTILEEMHEDLTEGFGFDTRQSESSFLNCLLTTCANQIASIWEMGQDVYFSHYPYTASGINLDNAVQFGGIRRTMGEGTIYPIFCTGDDGTMVPDYSTIASTTKPAVNLKASYAFVITRSYAYSATIRVVTPSAGDYTVSIDGEDYTYTSVTDNELAILQGLYEMVKGKYIAEINEDDLLLKITSNSYSKSLSFGMSENLTTEKVTSIGNYTTEDFGKIKLPEDSITEITIDVPGMDSVTNKIAPTYGRKAETDDELRHSYLQKSAIRGTSMIDSITAHILNNVDKVKFAAGFENDTDTTDSNGLPPHSIEIVVEGGEQADIAKAILQKKAGGIYTYGQILTNIPGRYGEDIAIRFSRPKYQYSWLKVFLTGNKSDIPSNYTELCTTSIINNTETLGMGDSLLIQTLLEDMYKKVSGIQYAEIWVAYSNDESFVPSSGDYKRENILVSYREMIKIDKDRIEVVLNG